MVHYHRKETWWLRLEWYGDSIKFCLRDQSFEFVINERPLVDTYSNINNWGTVEDYQCNNNVNFEDGRRRFWHRNPLFESQQSWLQVFGNLFLPLIWCRFVQFATRCKENTQWLFGTQYFRLSSFTQQRKIRESKNDSGQLANILNLKKNHSCTLEYIFGKWVKLPHYLDLNWAYNISTISELSLFAQTSPNFH